MDYLQLDFKDFKVRRSKLFVGICAVALLFAIATPLAAQTTPAPTQAPGLNISLNGLGAEQDLGVAIQIVFLMTLLTLAPSILVMMTSFTRIIIVLGFVRNAVGVPAAPSNQIIIGIALFLTIFVMSPILDRINNDALQPYLNDQITSTQALDSASEHIKDFMLSQTRQSDIEFFLGLSGMGPTSVQNLPLRIVIPSFVMSELRTAFQMGFLVFLPFVMIDFLVATTLMSMGMMMMPPVIVSLPFKILLFVIVDGWYLVIKSLTQSFTL